MRRASVFHLISLVVGESLVTKNHPDLTVSGERLITIVPKSHPNLMVSIRKPETSEATGMVALVGAEERKKTGKSSSMTFGIDSGLTRISQGKLHLCKSTSGDEITVCKGEDDLFSKWELISEDGVRFQTEGEMCMEVEEAKKGAKGPRLVGRKCEANSKKQLFNVEFVKSREPDDSNINNGSGEDLPMGEYVPFMLNTQRLGRTPKSKKVVVYDNGGKRMASFVGPVNPPVSDLNPDDILPHSNKEALPRPKSVLSGAEHKEDMTLTPSYANYGAQ